MNRRLVFITHADVAIDPDVAVTAWPLSARVRIRHEIFASSDHVRNVKTVVSSAERKAVEGARILSQKLEVAHHVVAALHENDRSATGYLPKAEFEATANAFFAQPDVSVRGWESARSAQNRIVKACRDIVALWSGDIAVVAHGGVGALLYCALQGVEISRAWDQPGAAGGNFLEIAVPDW
ncbi:MAG: histidine phosphatase family protein, partial [Pseudomonadota bacterium]